MYLDLSEESKTLRKELRAYFAEIINDEDRRALVDQTEGGPVFDRILRRMGKDGWLGLGWPEEFGGRGENPEALYVFYDEGDSRQCAAVAGHAEHRRTRSDQARDASSEGLLPASDPGGRVDLCHRLHRTQCGHRPRGTRNTRPHRG